MVKSDLKGTSAPAAIQVDPGNQAMQDRKEISVIQEARGPRVIQAVQAMQDSQEARELQGDLAQPDPSVLRATLVTQECPVPQATQATQEAWDYQETKETREFQVCAQATSITSIIYIHCFYSENDKWMEFI